MARDKDYIRMIHTQRWIKLRHRILTSHPLCERCEAEGYITPATEVHHITPVEDAVTYAEKVNLMFDPHNLRALCHECHVKTHTELGRSGKEATRRRNEDHVRSIEKRFFQ